MRYQSGGVDRQCVIDSKMSPLIVALFIQELQTNYTIHFHVRTLSPSFMKSTVNTPSRNNRNILGPIPKKVQGRGSSFFYSHHLPSGIPLESQNHKFQVKPLESSLQPFQETVHPVWVSTYLELRPGRGPPALLDLA